MPKTALVLCGGGSRGAAEAGYYQALREAGVSIDFIVGTSVGAVNGAYIAAGCAPEEIRRLWIDLLKWKPFRFNWKVLWQLHRAESLLDPSGFKRMLEQTLPARRFEDLKVPLTVVAADLQRAEPVYLEKGDLVQALMASTALPFYLPPINLDGHQIVDGGVLNNFPLDVAVEKGAGRLFVMLCNCQDDMRKPARGFLDSQSRACDISNRQKLAWDLRNLKDKAEIILLAPCLINAGNIMDFSRTERILDEAYLYAKTALNSRPGGGVQEQ